MCRQVRLNKESSNNGLINPAQNFLNAFVKIKFKIDDCLSSRIKINISKFYFSISLMFAYQNFQCYLIFKAFHFKSLNKASMLDLLASN